VGRAILGAVLAAAAIAPAGAAEVVFRPSLSFGVLHDGNVDVVGTGRGDDAAQIWADLAVDRTGPQSKLSFVYTPSYRKYRNASDLDYFGNAVVLSYAREPSRRTRTVVNVDATRSDTQGIQSYNTDRPLTFVPRTTTYRFLGDVAGTVGLARRSLIDWEARVQSDRYDSTDTTTYINSASVAALGGWRYEVSERSTIGLALRVDWFVYEDKPTIHIPDVVTETLCRSVPFGLRRHDTNQPGVLRDRLEPAVGAHDARCRRAASGRDRNRDRRRIARPRCVGRLHSVRPDARPSERRSRVLLVPPGSGARAAGVRGGPHGGPDRDDRLDLQPLHRARRGGDLRRPAQPDERHLERRHELRLVRDPVPLGDPGALSRGAAGAVSGRPQW